jgi:hypothetical protein
VLLTEQGFFAVAIIVLAVVCGAGAAVAFTRARLTRSDRRLSSLEHKIDLLMTHFRLDYATSPRAVWQDLVNDPAQRASAIKAYREQHGVRLAQAPRAVEDYISERSRRAAAATEGRAGALPRPAGRGAGRANAAAPADPFGQPGASGSFEGGLG